jgi:Ca-activated chloride channel family protein
METLYQHPQGLGSLPKSDSQAKFVRRYQERYQWPLAFAFVLLLVEWVIQTRPATKEVPAAGKSPAIAPAKSAVTALLLLTMTLSAFASPSEARKAYEKGDYRSALEEYSRLAKERPDDARLQYNAGAAAYRAEDYETAANRFNDALRTTDLELQRNAYYNRANARYLQGDKTAEAGDKQKFWESSLEDYERALKLKKDDADAAYNRDLVKRKLEELKKQQEQQQKQPDNKNQDNKDNKDDKKDKQKQDKNEQQQKQDSKQNEQQSKDQQKGQKQDDKQKEDQKKQAEKDKQEQAKKDQQKQDEQKGDQDSAQQQAKKQSDGKQDKQGDKKPDEQGGQPMMAQGNAEMTQQQVMQLLDTLKAQEKALIFQPPGDAKNRPKSFKDW